jgi:hypothetical protein
MVPIYLDDSLDLLSGSGDLVQSISIWRWQAAILS